jgi:hypothetical protein
LATEIISKFSIYACPGKPSFRAANSIAHGPIAIPE